MTLISMARVWARSIKRDIVALWLAARDRRVPWHAKAVAGLIAAYALSPVDLIPDFIPVLGLLDDLLIIPLGIMLAVRLIPPIIMMELRREAEQRLDRPRSRIALACIIVIWLACAILLARAFWI